MKLNIDTTGVTFLCSREPQAKTDRETGAPKVDRETGEAQWQIQVVALLAVEDRVEQVGTWPLYADVGHGPVVGNGTCSFGGSGRKR